MDQALKGGFTPLDIEDLRKNGGLKTGPHDASFSQRHKPTGTVGGFPVQHLESSSKYEGFVSGPKVKKQLLGPALRSGLSASGPVKFVGELEENLPEIEIINEVAPKTREELDLEGEMIKQTYINEGIQARNEAKAWADKMVAMAKKDIAKMYEDHNKECERIKIKTYEEANERAYAEGFSEGKDKGYEEGYTLGLRKCKETMQELLSALEGVVNGKDEIFQKYEAQLFDSIFTIANKVTSDSLKQRDKAVILKMLKSAAKGFRNSEYVKITLSKLDVEGMTTAEMDSLRDVFRDTQHIEIEVLKDAPAGTLILDSGSEITDAGIPTQLKMIENLGKGKFRDSGDDK
ncbi:MAG: hypothetical protein LBR74_04435 [Eubacterium sp.]|jgi:flagellar biosynthesis/type III secretory pathway protein FliH|nr:hypothetical protein [Eubacterium sp.]